MGAITMAPTNTLVVRGRDAFANMTCVSNANDEIAWSYDGNTVIQSPCHNNTDVFIAERESEYECGINASLERARADQGVRSISGPYGCTDRSNDAITETSMVIVLGKLLF